MKDNYNIHFYSNREYILIKRYLSERMFVLCGRVDDDLISDVMLKGMAKSHQFDPTKAKKTTWLFTIMRNQIYTNYYNKKKFTPVEIDGYKDYFIDETPIETKMEKLFRNHYSEIIDDLMRSEVKGVLWALKEYTINKKGYQQIADESGYKLGTIKSMINRDRKLINERWQRYKEE